MAAPARVEWWGDEVASVRSFDLDSQRSGETLARITILPVRAESVRDESVRSAAPEGGQRAAPLARNLLDLLPTHTPVLLGQESAVERQVDAALGDAAHHPQGALRLGDK